MEGAISLQRDGFQELRWISLALRDELLRPFSTRPNFDYVEAVCLIWTLLWLDVSFRRRARKCKYSLKDEPVTRSSLCRGSLICRKSLSDLMKLLISGVQKKKENAN